MEQTMAVSDAPNWDDVHEEIHCPLCAYNLRGLIEPRCPECGFRFEWQELLDPAQRLHPYLFEHHPKRNGWSFVQTLWGGLRPRRFWRSLHPAQPSRLGRLLLYWGFTAGVVLMAAFSTVVPAAITQSNLNGKNRRWYRAYYAGNPSNASALKQIVAQWGSLDAFMDHYAPPVASWQFIRELFEYHWPLRSLVRVTMAYLAWPMLTFLSLLVFRWSMQRAKVRARHVLRCVVYSFDAAVWTALIVVLILLVAGKAMAAGGARYGVLGLILAMATVSLLTMVYRLYVAYRLYVRLDHPLATIVASQVMAGLGAFNLFLIIYLVW